MRLNWTKVGLKVPAAMPPLHGSGRLNWTKVGLKEVLFYIARRDITLFELD